MSGACEKCGEHCLDCECQNEKGKFFYQGRYFEKQEDFWSYVHEFSCRETTEEDFNSLFDMLKRDVFMNIQIINKNITNSDIRNILEETFIFMILKIQDISKA